MDEIKDPENERWTKLLNKVEGKLELPRKSFLITVLRTKMSEVAVTCLCWSF
jgi:hypothetical protein